MFNRIQKNIFLILLVIILIFSSTYMAGAAEGAAPGVENITANGVAPEAENTVADSVTPGVDNTATNGVAPGIENITVDYEKATLVAEKMYYCGELYLFTNSMMKINYDMAALAANLKEYIGNSRLTSDKTILNNLIRQYNSISETYNSWVDVKSDLERYIEIIGNNKIYNKTQLQSAFRNTLITINATKPLLESGREYAESLSRELRTELNNDIDSTIRKAANANKIIEPSITKSLDGYRSLFDEFAAYAGINIADGAD